MGQITPMREERALGKLHRHLIIGLGSQAILIKADLVWYSEGQEIVVLSEQTRQNDARNRTEIPQDAKGGGPWSPEVRCHLCHSVYS